MGNSSLRYWLILHPDVSRPIGGVKQVHRLAESLIKLGRKAVLVQDQASFHPGWFESDSPAISLADWQSDDTLSPLRDTIILPEPFILHLDQYKPGIPKIVYNQNGHYTFLDYLTKSQHRGQDHYNKIRKIYRHHPDLKAVLCVSRYDQKLLATGVGLPADKVVYLRNVIEPCFGPVTLKDRSLAFMPRKNGSSSRAVISMLHNQPWFEDWQVCPISNCSQLEVAQRLAKAQLFLSFGHPEGFGLPVAEAMACGCYCIGYTGLGGRELFIPAQQAMAAEAVEPDDWLGFLSAIKSYILRSRISPDEMQQYVTRNAQLVSRHYSLKHHLKELAEFLSRHESRLPAAQGKG